MPVDFARLRTVFTVASLVVIVQPAVALDRMHDHRHAHGSVGSLPVPPSHYDTPSYDDPSKFGGESVMGSEVASSSVAPVHVQPRGGGFAPNSDKERLVQRQITDFNEMQRHEDELFDRRLLICRGC